MFNPHRFPAPTPEPDPFPQKRLKRRAVRAHEKSVRELFEERDEFERRSHALIHRGVMTVSLGFLVLLVGSSIYFVIRFFMSTPQ